MAKAPEKKLFSFGTCTFARTSPSRESLNSQTKILNICLTFEESLKLSLAIDECIRKLNSYNRSKKAGKATGLNVAVHLAQQRITVNEQKI